MIYDIETIRFWEYSIPMLREKKMYNLLPLIIFRHRKILKRVADNRPKVLEEKEKLKEDINSLSKEVKLLIDEHELDGEDVHKIAVAMTNLTEYLNSKYIKDENFDKEVIKVTKTLYDPLVKKEGVKEGQKVKAFEVARKMFAKGMSLEDIQDLTGLSEEELKTL